MQRIITRFSFITCPLIISLILLGLPLPLFAQTEDITITTYYPSPSGSFSNLTVNQNLNFENGVYIRVRQPGGSFVNVAQFFWDHIDFLVPINPGRAINFGDIFADNITAQNSLIVGDINVGNALRNRILWDWVIYGNQIAQSGIIATICSAVALAGVHNPLVAIMVAGALASLISTLPPFFLPPFPN